MMTAGRDGRGALVLPAATQAALAWTYVRLVHGSTFEFEHDRAVLSPCEVAVASGREASNR